MIIFLIIYLLLGASAVFLFIWLSTKENDVTIDDTLVMLAMFLLPIFSHLILIIAFSDEIFKSNIIFKKRK